MRAYEFEQPLNESLALSIENAIKRAWWKKFMNVSTVAEAKLELQLLAQEYYKGWLRHKTFANVKQNVENVLSWIEYGLKPYGFETSDRKTLMRGAGLKDKIEDTSSRLTDREVFKLLKQMGRWVYTHTDAIEQAKREVQAEYEGKKPKSTGVHHIDKPSGQKSSEKKLDTNPSKKKVNVNQLSRELGVNITEEALHGLKYVAKLGYLYRKNGEWRFDNQGFWVDYDNVDQEGALGNTVISEQEKKYIDAFAKNIANHYGKPAEVAETLSKEYGHS